MSIKIGDLNVADEIIQLHFQLLKTQFILQHIINNNFSTISIKPADLKKIEDRALKQIQDKFPTMGIKRTP